MPYLSYVLYLFYLMCLISLAPYLSSMYIMYSTYVCMYFLYLSSVCILCMYFMYLSDVSYVCIVCIFCILYIYVFKSIALEKTPNFFCSFQLFKYYYHEEITAELPYCHANSAIKKQKTRKFTLMDIVPHANYSDLK